MSRRGALAAASAALLLPRTLRAQAPASLPRVVILSVNQTVEQLQTAMTAPGPLPEPGGPQNWSFFFDELRRRGWRDGETMSVGLWSVAENPDPASWTEVIREMLATGPDVILCQGSSLTRVLMAETATIPIVAGVTDPLDAGIVTSLARPEGNVTGWGATDVRIDAKRIQLLVEMAPAARRIAFAGWRRIMELPGMAAALPGMVADLAGQGIETVVMALDSPASVASPAIMAVWLDGLIARVQGEGCGGLAWAGGGAFAAGTALDLPAAARALVAAGLPTIQDGPNFLVAGGLMSYHFEREEVLRGMAQQAARILEGARPADLPFQLPTIYELWINRTTADALGLAIPPSLAIMASEIVG